MRWRRLTINSRLSCAVCAPSTLKKLKSVNLSKRILPASKSRHPWRSHLRLAWPRLPYGQGLRCRWRPQLPPLHLPTLRLPPMLRPISPHSLGPRLLLGHLRSLAVLLLALPLLGRTLLLQSIPAVPRRCSGPNLPMRRKNVFNNINVGFPLLLLPI